MLGSLGFSFAKITTTYMKYLLSTKQVGGNQMKRIKKFLVGLIILDWIKLNLWQIYTMIRRTKDRGEDWDYKLLRRVAPSWKDDVVLYEEKKEKEVNE